MSDVEVSLEVYAGVLTAMASGASREDALREHGVSEDDFEALEEDVEAEFSKAMDHEGDSVAPFLQKYEAAVREAQARLRGGAEVPLEQFARGLAAVQRGGDPVLALSKLGLQPNDLVRALGQWGPRLARDPELAARFEAIRSGRVGRKPGET